MEGEPGHPLPIHEPVGEASGTNTPTLFPPALSFLPGPSVGLLSLKGTEKKIIP